MGKVETLDCVVLKEMHQYSVAEALCTILVASVSAE